MCRIFFLLLGLLCPKGRPKVRHYRSVGDSLPYLHPRRSASSALFRVHSSPPSLRVRVTSPVPVGGDDGPAPCVPGDEQVCWIHVPPVGLVGGCRSERRSSASGLTTVNDLQGESMSCCLYFKSPPVGLALGRVSDFFFFLRSGEIRSFWADTGHCGSGWWK